MHTHHTQTHINTHTHTHTQQLSDSNWGARDAWSNSPQLLLDNYFVGSRPPLIICLPYDDSPPPVAGTY